MSPPNIGWALVGGGFLLACWALGLAYNAGRYTGAGDAKECIAKADSLTKRIGLPVYTPNGTLAWNAPPIDSTRSHLPTSRGRR